MKLLRWLLLIVAAMALTAEVAWANRVAPGGVAGHWRGGSFAHEHHGWHHHHGHGAVIFALPLFAPAFDDPLYPTAPAPTIAPPPVYIERGDGDAGATVAAAPPEGVWYYCEAAGTYYPYVRECPAAWKVVPAQQ